MKSRISFRFTGFVLTSAYTTAAVFAIAACVELIYRFCSLVEDQVTISVSLASNYLNNFF